MTDAPEYMAQPADLGEAGAALWALIVSALDVEIGDGEPWDLSEREVAYLTLACRQADDTAKLEALVSADGLVSTGSTGQPVLNAAVAEIRNGRIAVERFLSKLQLPDTEEGRVTETGRRARNAANVRWDLDRRRRGAA